MPKKHQILTPVQAAAVEAGASLEDVLETTTEVDPTASGTGGKENTGDSQAESETEAQSETSSDAQDTPAPSVSSDSSLVTYLQAELHKAQQSAVELMVENKSLKAEIDACSTSISGMHAALCDTVNTKRVGLGMSRIDYSQYSATGLLQEYAAITKQFQQAYPVGGRAQMPSTDNPGEGGADGSADAAEARAKAKAARIK